MILFKPEHAELILEGRKTQTRRFWKACRIKLGSVHQCYTRPAFARPPGKPFATIEIVSIRRQAVFDMTLEDLQAEGGYTSQWEYAAALAKINGIPYHEAHQRPAWVVDFQLIGGTAEKPHSVSEGA